MSGLSPQEARRIRDHVEAEVLTTDEVELIVCEAAWCCGCPEGTEKFAVADAAHPMKFGFCWACSSAAIVVPWGHV